MAQVKALEQPMPIPTASMADLKIQSPDPSSPASRPSMQDPNGTWLLEKHLSSNIPLLLKLQKIPFLIRHAITSSPVHLILTQYTKTNAEGQKQTHLDLIQRTAGSLSLPVIEDKRVLDWVEREHEDFVFGRVLTRSVFVRGSVSDKGAARPDFDVNVRVKEGQEVIERFLRGEIDVDEGQTDGFLVEKEEGKGLWVHTLEINEKSAWTAETVWGFEVVKGERYLTSRVVVVNGKGKYQLGRMVFKFLSRVV
ncbi:hypothetical protein BJX65DRAFT_272582 [Aspergillus insuetus]